MPVNHALEHVDPIVKVVDYLFFWGKNKKKGKQEKMKRKENVNSM